MGVAQRITCSSALEGTGSPEQYDVFLDKITERAELFWGKYEVIGALGRINRRAQLCQSVRQMIILSNIAKKTLGIDHPPIVASPEAIITASNRISQGKITVRPQSKKMGHHRVFVTYGEAMNAGMQIYADAITNLAQCGDPVGITAEELESFLPVLDGITDEGILLGRAAIQHSLLGLRPEETKTFLRGRAHEAFARVQADIADK